MGIAKTNKICEMAGREIESNSIKFSYKPTNLERQPNAIIKHYFKNKLAEKYNAEEKIRLIDYLYELGENYPEKNSIEAISTTMALRWRNEEENSRKLEFEDYISYIFKEHSNTPEELMSYVLGDRWEIFQVRLEARPKKIKEYLRAKIEEEMRRLKELSEEKKRKLEELSEDGIKKLKGLSEYEMRRLKKLSGLEKEIAKNRSNLIED